MKYFYVLILVLFGMSCSQRAEAREAILYSHLTDGYWQIWMMNPDGGDQRQITQSPTDKRDPAGVDGRQFLFRTNNGELFLASYDGTQEKEILSQYKIINNPNVSAKTREIVFIRFDRRGKDIGDVWKADLDGQNVTLLTQDNYGKFQPSFSSQGDKITFVKAAEDQKSFHIWMMNADGGDLRSLTEGVGFDTHPAFSPDQEKITFSSNRGDDFEIYDVDVKSHRVRRLTNDLGLDNQSSYSSKGDQIIFVSNRSGHQQIWIMKSDGKDPVQLTSGEAESIDPVWVEIP